MKRITTLLLLSAITCYSQSDLEKMKGFWQNSNEKSIIDYYNGSTYLTFLYSKEKESFSGGKHSSTIGFYDSCEVAHIDSLKSSGFYYFEISDIDLNDNGEIEDAPRCLELNLYKEGENVFMNIYDSYRQQFSTYQKLEKLPRKLDSYLRKEHPEVYDIYQKSLSLPN